MAQSPGFDPNLQDVDRGYQNVIVITVCFVLIILSTSMRIGGKIWNRFRLGLDDYFILLSFAINTTANALEYRSLQGGFGRHKQFLTTAQVEYFQLLSQIDILLAVASLWSTKMSICFFILGIIRGTHKHLRWFAYGLMVLTTLSAFTQSMLWGFQAQPLEKLWHPEVPGHIAPKQQLIVSIIFSTAINAITDLFYSMAPIYFLARVQMSTKRKVMILGLTGSGFIVVAVSMIRVSFVEDFQDPDITWALQRVYLCTVVERNLAEFIADLPANYTLFHNLFKKIQTSINSRTQQSATGSGKMYGAGSVAGYGRRSTMAKDTLSSINDNHWYNSQYGKYNHGEDEDGIPLTDIPSFRKERDGIMVHNQFDVQSKPISETPSGSV